MASVYVSEIAVPWIFGLGLTPGSSVQTLGGIDVPIMQQLFKYQTFLKKCEDAMVAQGLEVFKPIAVSKALTDAYTPTDFEAFKALPFAEFTSVGYNWGTGFSNLWQRFYEFTTPNGRKLYVRFDFGICSKPYAGMPTYNLHQLSGYRVTIATSMGTTDVDNILYQRVFPFHADRSLDGGTHTKQNTFTDLIFTASERSVFFSFGGTRFARFGTMDGRVSNAIKPETLSYGPILTEFDLYAADVPKTQVAGVYFPPKLGVNLNNSIPSAMFTPALGGLDAGTGSQFTPSFSRVVTENGTYSLATTGVLPTELRSGTGLSRVYGMPFTLACSSGMLVAKDLVLMTDPDISSFNVQLLPFFVGENEKKVVRLPCLGQSISGQGASSNYLNFSYSSPETIQATGQTVLGVVLDAATALY